MDTPSNPLTFRGKIKAALESGDNRAALKTAAGGARYLGTFKDDISRGWEATVRPEMYRQMGKDPNVLISKGLEALYSFLEKP